MRKDRDMNDNGTVVSFKNKRKLTAEEQAEFDFRQSELAAKENAEKALLKLAEEEVSGEPDQVTINLLETMLQIAKQGQISGLAAIAWNPVLKGFNRFFCVDRASKVNNTINVSGMMFLGGLELIKGDISAVAFYPEHMAAAAEMMKSGLESVGE